MPVTALVGLGAEARIAIRADQHVRRPAIIADLDPQYAAPPSAPDGIGGLRGVVEFRDVSFGYDRRRGPVIAGLSFRAEPGQRGGGGQRTGGYAKSTVARLLAGAVRPWGGEILLDDVPREE